MSLDRESALDRFSQASVARLATISPEGAPHLVPITFSLKDNHLFTMVDSKPKTTMRLSRLENIAANPRVSVLADRYDHDWTRLWWVRIDGTATVTEQGPDWEMGQTLLIGKYRQYRDEPPSGAAIVVGIGSVNWWEWSP